MSSEDFSQVVLTMEPRADSICAVGERLLAALAEPGAENGDRLAEQTAHFVEETYRTVLNWMAVGKEEQVRALLAQFLAVLDHRPGGDVLARLSPDDQLAVRLAVLNEVGAVFLRTDNLARSLGALSGRRRAPWRRALSWIAVQRRPVRIPELQEQELFSTDDSAGYALDQLVELGFLDKRAEGLQQVAYDLTWAGHRIVQVLASSPPTRGVTRSAHADGWIAGPRLDSPS